MAGMARVTATVAVTPCIKSLCIERMYTFLGEGCAAEITRADNFNTKSGLRTMKSLRKTVFVVTILFSAAPFAAMKAKQPRQAAGGASTAQDSPSSPQQNGAQARIRIPVNLVIVPVTVKDVAGRLVPDLRQDEFRVFEDNIEQRVGFFRADVVPISMVVLIDNDLKSKDAKQVGESLRSIVAGLSLNDEAWVCRFDQFFHPGKGFIGDQA